MVDIWRKLLSEVGHFTSLNTSLTSLNNVSRGSLVSEVGAILSEVISPPHSATGRRVLRLMG